MTRKTPSEMEEKIDRILDEVDGHRNRQDGWGDRPEWDEKHALFYEGALAALEWVLDENDQIDWAHGYNSHRRVETDDQG